MLDWFTTIPGLLIIFGIILLVIAIVLFILGAKKSKNEAIPTANTVVNNTSTIVNPEPVMNTVANDMNVSPVVTNTPVNPSVNNTFVTPEVTIPNMDNSVQMANLNPQSLNSEYSVNEPGVINIPSVDVSYANQSGVNPVEPIAVVNTTPVVDPVSTIESTPVVNIPDINMDATTKEIEPITISEPTTIYGGETPIVNFQQPEDKPVTIYGGNDPLEATQALPKIDEHHEPYSGSYPEIRIVEPTINNNISTQVEETVSEIPTVEPIIINEPEVVNIPVEEPVLIQPTVIPAEENMVPQPINITEL